MTDDTMAALRETLLDRLLRFTTRTDLSVTACVEGDIRRVRADIVVIDATTPKQAIAEITRGL
jgi:hypothetical protein